MARSTYIYVVTVSKDIVVAFTVKHELQSWLKRMSTQYNPYRVWRVSDGGGKAPVDITEELAEQTAKIDHCGDVRNHYPHGKCNGVKL